MNTIVLHPHCLHLGYVARRRNSAGWITFLALTAGLAAVVACTGCSAPTLPDGVSAGDSSADSTLADAGGDQTAADTSGGEVHVDSVNGDTATSPGCKVDGDCATSDVQCYQSFCDKGTCNIKPVTLTQTCDDGNKCSEGDLCKGGKCTGTLKVCDDDNPCTSDLCIPAKGCSFNNINMPCNIDDICTVHACQGGSCAIVDLNPCDDNNPCTTDSCDASMGCKYKALTAVPCDDNDTCTKSDVCKFGQCAGKGKSCSDDNPCTDDGCDASGACANLPNSKACSDGKPCTIADACKNGSCSGLPKGCEDGSPCTFDSCDPVTGSCVASLPDSPTPCDDGNACTAGDLCSGYVCQSGTAQTCDDGNDCTVDTCDVATGTCSNLPATDGDACGQANLCLVEPKCQTGVCAGALKVCDDNNPCTQDLCDALSGQCIQANVSDGTKCGDGLTCQSGVCL